MDSYFATVEQQANPHLRGKPIVVSGKEGSRTVIVAASKEAKKFGVKTAMPIFEAKKLCPQIYFVYPDGDKYQETTDKFLKIFKQFTEKVEVFSIDEAFVDLTGYLKNFSQALTVAQKVKLLIKQEVGEWVTCSIGIAANKLLAKLASDIKKPDGIFIIDEKNKFEVLDQSNLDDFCGIGARLLLRLEMLGVESVKKLRRYPVAALKKEFGPFAADFLHRLSFGEDDREVIPYFNEAEIKSIGRSYTLPADTWDKKEISQTLLHLCENCGRGLRRKKLAGKTLQYYFRFADFTHGGMRLTLPGYVNDGLAIYQIGVKLLDGYRLQKAVRKVGVCVSNLVKDFKQLPLWVKDRKRLAVLPYLDAINDKYGDLTIKPAFLADANALRKKVGGFKY